MLCDQNLLGDRDVGSFCPRPCPDNKITIISAFFGLIGFSAQAQGTIFCPATINGVGGFQLVNGLCTNGNTGAFSTAALSSQALGDIQQSVTAQTTTAALDAISARRKEEVERCPVGFERSTDGTCKRTVVAEPSPRVSSSRPTAHRQKAPAPMMPVKAPVVVDPGWRWGAWAHGFGYYERRTDSGTGIVSGTVGGGRRRDADTCCRSYPDGEDGWRHWRRRRHDAKSVRWQRRFDRRNVGRLYLDRHLLERYVYPDRTDRGCDCWIWRKHWAHPCFRSHAWVDITPTSMAPSRSTRR